jgi:hypothetical protein
MAPVNAAAMMSISATRFLLLTSIERAGVHLQIKAAAAARGNRAEPQLGGNRLTDG